MIVHASVQKSLCFCNVDTYMLSIRLYGFFFTDLDSCTIIVMGFGEKIPKRRHAQTQYELHGECCTCSSRVLGTTNLTYAHIIIIIIIIVVRLATTETTALRL